ncbi:MAG: UDP-N-acetylglucosamine 2-epimerase (non-hydrolyzing) [Tannerella sp.]|jgi:UDP-GlcNAc3NAcA epimerase|nr:UDP-N-acetylglucosamine 2-epimerase (non-hydrolyzing) [Tannerella sp.]
MKIVTVIGARPQFVKAAMISKAIGKQNAADGKHGIREYILHTGQHYDPNMNDIFLTELGIKTPDWQLHCGGLSGNAAMLAEMLIGIEKALLECRPDGVLVYGDTTSTLAGALAASRLQIPVLHVEAGLRSFNRQMPEEINRILTDHIASLLFCPTCRAVRNLAREGITDGIFHTGDVMYDAALAFGKIAEDRSGILFALGLQPRKYRLCTVHRAENTNDPERLAQIVRALVEIATSACPVIFPLHPRTERCLRKYSLNAAAASCEALRMIDPVSYLDMIMLEKNAETVLTDSGGVQKEAFFHGTPCITLREETEWVETVEAGWNQIAGFRMEAIIECLGNKPEKTGISEYGDGDASGKIVRAIVRCHENSLL